ncbi:MAG: DUF6531 domain-containing protein, partial [Chloroflexi bacterium]|nr:DUF6531 domain-containing protein [Chloroflexota bacterium]
MFGPYARVIGGSKGITSSSFTIPAGAQTVRFWMKNSGGATYATLLRATDNQQLRSLTCWPGANWVQYSFNVSDPTYQGIAVKLSFTNDAYNSEFSLDSIEFVTEIPGWETTSDKPSIASEGGPVGQYAKITGNSKGITSSIFTIPSGAQTVRFWLRADSGGAVYGVLVRASDGQTLRSLTCWPGANWMQYSFDVSDPTYQGISVKFKVTNDGYTPESYVDNIEFATNVPGWATNSDQPSIATDSGPFGPYVKGIGYGKSITSSSFTIPSGAQTVRFWMSGSGAVYVDLLRDSDSQKLQGVTCWPGTNWAQYSLSISDPAYQDMSVRLRFLADGASPGFYLDQVEMDGIGNWLGANPNVGQDGEPVNMTTGNYLYNHQDLAIPGRGLGLTLSRSYNSLGTGSSIFGNRWSFNYGMSLAVNADNSVTLGYPDGRKVTYTRNSDGSYNRPTGVYDNLIRNGDGSFTLTTKGQAHFNFSADGRLISLVDRNGNTLSLAYRADGLLRSSTDPSGRTLTFSYGAAENAQVLATPTAVLAFPNADFEQGTYANWTTTGTAFGSAPSSYGDPGKQGTYQANSYRPLGSDTPVGTITSTGFVAGRQLLFRVGGGSDSSTHKVSLLLDDDTEVLTHSNTTSTAELRVVTWDTTPWEGQRVRLRAADTAAGGSWGWVSIDDVRVVYAPSGTVPAPLGNDVLPFANGNFEDGSYLNWFATGTAFGVRPITNSDAGREGGYYANSYDPTVSDAATATLTSAPFTASRSLSFLVNGGNKPDSTYVALVLADGTEVLKTTHAANTKVLDPVTWDTSPYEGQTVRIRLVDNDTTSWGWIGVDNVRILYGADLVQQVTDPAGAVYRYSYDPSGNLIAYTDPNGGSISYEYGPYGVTRATDQNGHSFVDNGYDVRGRVVEQLDALGNVTTFSYDVANRTTTYTDQLGNSRVYTFDSSGRTISVRDELGNTESYGYDSAGNRVAVTDRNGATIHYSYDAMGNVTSATDPSNATESYGYDAQNNPLTRTDALGRITRFAYDAAGNLVRTTDPLGHETAMAYDGFGQLTSTTDPLGNVTGYGYDAFGNQTAVTDSRGKTTQRQFDAAGRLIAQTDPLGHTTRYSYRADGQLLRTTDALGHEAGFTYDAVGNRTSATDPNGRTTLYGYDEADRLVSVTDPVGQTTSYGYDLVGRRTSTTDAMGRTTRYQLDASGRLVKETDPAGHSWEYSYTNTGNVLTRKDANLATTSYGYDANGRVSEVTYPVGQVTHQYDAAGRRTSSSGPAGALSYSYDELGRLAWVTDPSGATVSYGYDEAGRRTKLTYPDGKVATYGYDGDGRLTSVTDWLGKVTGYSYDDAGRLVSTTYPNGAVAARSYDDANRLVSIVAAKDGTTLASFGYTLDNAGMRTAVQTLAGTESYGYDSLYRLTSATYPDGTAQSYSYDPVGNRLGKVENGAPIPYSYDTADRMTAAGGVSYGYDANGDQISRGADVFSWDYENRLIGATLEAGNVSYSYRPDGLRHT